MRSGVCVFVVCVCVCGGGGCGATLGREEPAEVGLT